MYGYYRPRDIAAWGMVSAFSDVCGWLCPSRCWSTSWLYRSTSFSLHTGLECACCFIRLLLVMCMAVVTSAWPMIMSSVVSSTCLAVILCAAVDDIIIWSGDVHTGVSSREGKAVALPTSIVNWLSWKAWVYCCWMSKVSGKKPRWRKLKTDRYRPSPFGNEGDTINFVPVWKGRKGILAVGIFIHWRTQFGKPPAIKWWGSVKWPSGYTVVLSLISTLY